MAALLDAVRAEYGSLRGFAITAGVSTDALHRLEARTLIGAR